jgi:DnaJ family protein C protein 7
MGNIVRKSSDDLGVLNSGNKLDPEVLKSLGNEAYKENRFEEALALYDRAIALDSNKAAYHSNKSASLIGLGRLIEAVFECKEAIQIEPTYHKAHYRLATAYLR